MIKLKIKSDSRKINKGDIFVDFEDNEEYVLDAINRGAKKVIVKDKFYDVETKIVNDPKQYIADYLYQKYQKNFKKITMIGGCGWRCRCSRGSGSSSRSCRCWRR